jgi:hypothetical protein
VRREHGHGLSHRRRQPADGVAQGLAHAGVAFAGERIGARVIDQTGMHVQAVAGLVAEGLGHEAGEQPVAPGHGLDRALEQDGVVRRAQRVRHMAQVHLVLAGALFGDDGIGGQCLRPAGLFNVAEHLPEAVEFVQAEQLGDAVAGEGGRRHRLAARPRFAGKEAKFQFRRDHRGESARVQALAGAG